MKNKFGICFFILLFGTCATLLGQSTTEQYAPRLNPISPTAYEFMKYGDIPVSEYSGVPNISIPVHTIKTSGLDIPISLSYHAAGVRVSEEASWVGLGWKLNVDGTITQIVNALDDYGLYKSRVDIDPGEFNFPPGAADNCTVLITEYDDVSRANDAIIPPQYFTGYEDTEPDLFKFSFLNWSGEFILDWVNEVYICLTDKNVVVVPINMNHNGRPGAFDIKVPEGHTFVFELKEETTIERQVTRITQNPDARQHPSGPVMDDEVTSRSYKLTRITTNQGEVITLDYTMSNDIINLPGVSVTNELNELSDNFSIGDDWHNQVRTRFPDVIEYTNYISTNQKLAYLNSITTDKESITFNSSNDRIDLNGTRKLNSIVVRSHDNDIYSHHVFNYDYFIGHTNGSDNDGYLSYLNINKTPEELTHRLKLTSIQMLGEPSYEFEYFSEQLPKKTSLAVDYWGYYNRVLNNTSMYPNLYRFGLTYDIGLGNNKSADLTGTKAAVLAKIVYPTGGNTKFDYALNSFDNYYTPSIDETLIPGETSTVYVYDNNQTADNVFEVVRVPELGGHFEGQVAISGPCTALSFDENNVWVKIIKVNEEKALVWDNQPWQIGSIISDPTNYEWEEKFFFTAGEMTPTNFSKFIEVEYTETTPGLMVFWATLADGCGEQNSAGDAGFAAADIDYTTFGDGPIENIGPGVEYFGAGLRVASITSYTDDVNKASQTSYEYEGGKLMSPLTYIDQYNTQAEFRYLFNDICFGPEWYGTTTRLNTSTINPYSTSASGAYVGYDKVTRRQVNVDNDIADNGKVVTEFLNVPDYGSIDFVGNGIFTKLPLTKSYPTNGLIKSSIIYDDNDNPIRRTDNVWSVNSGDCYFGAKFQWSEQRWNGFSCATIYNNFYKVGFYPMRQIETLHTTQTVLEYWGTNVKSTTTSYTYNSRNEIERISFADSKGRTVETQNYYPYDFSGIFVMDQMVNENYISPIIQQEQFIDSELIRTRKTDYTMNPGYFAPSEIKTSIHDELLTTEITFNKYDNSRLVEYTQRNGQTITLLWGYDYKYVVAQVLNADFSTCSSIIDQSVLNAPATDLALLTELNKLRSALPSANVTSYAHKPLVGISSMADVNNQSESYEYDTYGRLIGILDQEGNYLKNLDYNFVDTQSVNPRLHNNYILSEDILTEGITLRNQISSLDYTDKRITYNYSDGLGRTFQTVNQQQTPGGKDMIQYFEYDGYGRRAKSYLPFKNNATNGLKADFVTAFSDFYLYEPYIDHDTAPVAVSLFEASPLNRILEQGSPGLTWQLGLGNTIKYQYRFNHPFDVVSNWEIQPHSEALKRNSNYAANELTKTVIIDEEGHSVIEFTDKQGRVLLKRVQAVENPNSVYISGEWADTYYVYDDLGNLRYVLPPEAANKINLWGSTIPSAYLSYGFNTGSGTVAIDDMNGFDGTVIGPSWTAGKNGQALSFDGINDKVTVPHSSALNISNNLSVGAWIKAADPGSNGGIIIGKHHGGNANNARGWIMSASTVDGDKLQVVVSENGTSSSGNLKLYYSSIPVFDNEWHHVGFTFSSNQLKLFIDGVEDLNVYKVRDDNVVSIYTNSEDLTIGWHEVDNAATRFFDGIIDEVTVYDQLLTPEQMAGTAGLVSNITLDRWAFQ